MIQTILIILIIAVALIYWYSVYHKVTTDKSSTIITTPPSSTENNTNEVFIRDWPLLDFALEFGPKMEIDSFISKDGRPFHVCRFTQEEGTETIVYFFSQLGELSSAEIKERKHELYVGQTESGKYYLHDKNVRAWEEVDLNL